MTAADRVDDPVAGPARPSIQDLHPPGRWARFRALLPTGQTLPEDAWRPRHRFIMVLLWAHIPLLVAFGAFSGTDHLVSGAMFRGVGWETSLLEGAVIALFAGAASWPGISRRIRSVAASVGLATCSAVLTQFSGGFIEAHFHFFVVVGIIAMYHDWVPFLVAVGYVAAHHGFVGTLDPSAVYNHPAAIAFPWRWASIHAFFIAFLSVAQIVHWRMTEHAKARTEMVLESAGDALFGFDREARVVFANPAAARMLQSDRRALLRRPLPAVLHLEHGGRPVSTSRLMEAAGNGQVHVEVDDELVRDDGSRLPVEWTAAPMRERGILQGAVITVKDISERKRAETQRLEAQARLREVEHLKEQDAFKMKFMNMAAHELNTPLTPVQIQIRLLKQIGTDNLNPTQRNAVEMIGRNVDRFSRLVSDLLEAARFQGDRLGVDATVVDVAAIVGEVADTFGAPAAENGVRIDSIGPKELRTMADAQRLYQVLNNVMNNALKYTPRGGTVTLAAEENGDRVRVMVSDTGLGMTKEQISRLFQPFSQVQGRGDQKEGSGLGLYLSKSIIELHGGTMWCESDGPSKGSRFVFEIPSLRVASMASRTDTDAARKRPARGVGAALPQG